MSYTCILTSDGKPPTDEDLIEIQKFIALVKKNK